MLDIIYKKPSRDEYYKNLLEGAAYVYITADVIKSPGVRGLWNYIFDRRAFSHPFIITEPGAERIKALEEYRGAPAFGSYSRYMEYAESTRVCPYRDREFFCLLKREWEDEDYHNRRRHLVIMSDPASEWRRDDELSPAQDGIRCKRIESSMIMAAVNHKMYYGNQIVISQDRELHAMLKSCPGYEKGSFPTSLRLYCLEADGELVDPFVNPHQETADRQLELLAESAQVYMDETAFKHAQSWDFLSVFHQYLRRSGRSLAVLADKNKALRYSDYLMRWAQEIPPTVRFIWINAEQGNVESMVEALLEDLRERNTKFIALVTNRVPRAEKLQAILEDYGVQVDIYSINKYGYLSCRDKGKPGLRRARGERQRLLVRLRIENDVNNTNVSDLIHTTQDINAWEEGVRYCIEEKKIDILDILIDSKENIPGSILRWWICQCREFQSPSYLAENPRLYTLMRKMIDKISPSFHFGILGYERMMERLDMLASKSRHQFVELDYIIDHLKKLDPKNEDVSPIRFLDDESLPRTSPDSHAMLKVQLKRKEGRLAVLKQEIRILQKEEDELRARIEALRKCLNLEAR